ncbi:hypothetical protein ABE042_21870 [Viridibacillus arvi]|uniref:hypothetical protein n=1 Tax=Viridibacillus arvi TaxID=263475 RepID=UPI003D29095B
MNLAQIEIAVDKEMVQQSLDNIVRDYTRPRLLLCDIEELKRITCMSPSSLERHILHDPRVKQHERRVGERGKRYWIYEPIERAILEIIDELE